MNIHSKKFYVLVVVLLVLFEIFSFYSGYGVFILGAVGESMEPTYGASIDVYESIDTIESVSEGDIVVFSADNSSIPVSHRIQDISENLIYIDGDSPVAMEHTFTHTEFEKRVYGKAIYIIELPWL